MDDDDDEFPPVLHPGRELATLTVAAILVVALILWLIVSIARWI